MPVASPQPVWSPVVGAPTEAYWAGNVAEAVVQRFATTAERDARWTTPPNGSICVTTNTTPPSMWQRSGGTWVQIGPPVVRAPYTGTQTIGGALVVNGDVKLMGGNPPGDEYAARKAYVDVRDGLRVSVSGDTIQPGPLLLKKANGDPFVPDGPAQAVPKQYVDTQDGKRVAVTGDTMTGMLVLDNKDYANDNCATRRQWQVATFLNKTGDVMTGNLNMNGNNRIINLPDPTVGDHAATPHWVSANFQAKGGCDYRLKEFVAPITNATERVLALARAAYRGRWTDDGDDLVSVHNGEQVQDFINAHDIAEVAPYAVYGEKDGEEMQTVDFGSLVPMLISALGDALNRVATLEARLA